MNADFDDTLWKDELGYLLPVKHGDAWEYELASHPIYSSSSVQGSHDPDNPYGDGEWIQPQQKMVFPLKRTATDGRGFVLKFHDVPMLAPEGRNEATIKWEVVNSI